jgi:hypothetical protein
LRRKAGLTGQGRGRSMTAWDVQVERAFDGRDVEEGEEFKLNGGGHV